MINGSSLHKNGDGAVFYDSGSAVCVKIRTKFLRGMGDRIVFSSFYFDGFTLIDSGTGDYQHISKPVPDRFRQDIESIQSLIFGLTLFDGPDEVFWFRVKEG